MHLYTVRLSYLTTCFIGTSRIHWTFAFMQLASASILNMHASLYEDLNGMPAERQVVHQHDFCLLVSCVVSLVWTSRTQCSRSTTGQHDTLVGLIGLTIVT